MKTSRIKALFVFLLFCSVCHAYEFIYGDDTRTGTLFAKDPIVV